MPTNIGRESFFLIPFCDSAWLRRIPCSLNIIHNSRHNNCCRNNSLANIYDQFNSFSVASVTLITSGFTILPSCCNSLLYQSISNYSISSFICFQCDYLHANLQIYECLYVNMCVLLSFIHIAFIMYVCMYVCIVYLFIFINFCTRLCSCSSLDYKRSLQFSNIGRSHATI